MADAEIQVVLSAVDKVSAQLTAVEKNLDSFSKKTTSASKDVAQSFNTATNSLIAVGNAAQAIDSIFSSITNLQLRLENATERVANATDRLADSQTRLNDAMEAQKSTSLELQRLSLAEEETKENLVALTNRYKFALSGGVNPASREYRDLIRQIKVETLNLEEIQERQKDIPIKAAKEVVAAQQDVERATRGLTIAENNLARAQNAVVGTYILVGIQAVSLAQSLPALIGAVGSLGAALGPVGLALVAAGAALAGLTFLFKDNIEVQAILKEVMDKLMVIWKQLEPALTEVLKALEPLVPPFLELVSAIADLAIALMPILLPALQAVAFILKQWAEIITTVIDLVVVLIGWVGKLIEAFIKINVDAFHNLGNDLGFNSPKKTRVGDAIIRPDGGIIQTDPRDTLIAMRDMDTSVFNVNKQGRGSGGVTVYIESVYGMNPRDLSRALAKELNTKRSI